MDSFSYDPMTDIDRVQIRTLITMEGEHNHSMGSSMDRAPPHSEDLK